MSGGGLLTNRSVSYWKSLVQNDGGQNGVDSITRWSLQSLSKLCSEIDSKSNISHTIVTDISYRLARQYNVIGSILEYVATLKKKEQENSSSSTVISSILQHYEKKLNTLQYVHYDTYKLCKQMVVVPDREQFWNRFSTSDQHTIHTIVEEIRSRHANTIETIADFVTALRTIAHTNNTNTNTNEQQLNSTITTNELNTLYSITDIFLQGRIGVQLLCDHHVKIYRNQYIPTCTGIVSVNADLYNDSILDAITEAKHMCDAHLQIVPDVNVIVGNNNNNNNNNNDTTTTTTTIQQTIIRPWIHYVLVELLKNSMASSVKKYQSIHQPPTKFIEHESMIPPITIHVYEPSSSVLSIDIIDNGIGFQPNNNNNNNDNTKVTNNGIKSKITSSSSIQDAFLLGHSTAGKKWDRLDEQQSYAAVRSPLSSLGVGLHSSRCMLEHYHGSIQLLPNNNNNNYSSTTANANTTNEDGCTARILLPKNYTLLERIPGQEIDTAAAYLHSDHDDIIIGTEASVVS